MPRVLLVAAVAITAVTRLGWLGLIEFENDEAWALTVASEIARGQAYPLVGIGSSLGIPNAPFFVYLMALPGLVGRNPALATGLIGLLGTAAVAATYGFASTLFDQVTAVSAALLYAVSPWGIVYSRKVWGQDALPLFVTLGFWALFASLLTGRCRLIAPGVVLLTLATQLHPTAFFLAAPAFVLVVGAIAQGWPRSWRSIRWLGLGLIGAAIVESPFLVWQTRHGWPLLDAVRHLARDPGRFDLTAARAAGSAIAGSGYPALAQVSNLWLPAGLVEVGLFLGGVALVVWRMVQPGPTAPRLGALSLLVWLAAPVLAQIHHSVPIYPHYFIVLYPACFVVMGVAVSALWGLGRRYDVPIFRGLAVVAVAAPVAFGIVAFQNYLGALQRGAVRPDFGVPLARQEALLDAADQLAGGGPVFFGAHDSLAPTLDYLGDGRWRIFDDQHGLRLPSSDHVSALGFSEPASLGGRLAARWFGAERAKTLTLTTWSQVALYRLAPGDVEADPGYHVLDVAFDNGMTLTGYRLASDSARQRLLIDLHWRFTGVPAARPPTVFNHLVGPRGETVAGIDGLAYDPADWRAGETGLDEFDLAWPSAPGPYHLQVGLYDYPSMRRYDVVSPAAGDAVDSIDLGPVGLTSSTGR
ncbi:MAG TPA: glycosyltransferase family 39 protein [Chloroflexota bacterium]|nr:glycosyltransferase family 39 protein [Chloroflexota bacterium]